MNTIAFEAARIATRTETRLRTVKKERTSQAFQAAMRILEAARVSNETRRPL